MKQTEIIAQLRSLRESQADFARTNGDEIFQRDVEALDAAIEALDMFQTYGIGHCYNKIWCGEVANGIRARVIAWMPLPEPPKRRK